MSFAALRAFALRQPWTVILASVLVSYWPLSAFGWTLAYGDTLDCWLPWRFFLASCLHDGHFPLWNPLQQMGYPIYADLQGPAWYVEAIALGGTVGHSLLVLQALFLGYCVVGGMGMRRLVQEVHGHAGAALVIGVAYALGGFFTGHTMHFYSVISAAWLPWLLEAQLRLMRAPHWRPALSAAVFQYFLLSGGNHTFTILVAYLVAGLFVVRTVVGWRAGDRALVKRMVSLELGFAVASVVLACGTLYAAWEVAPYLARAEGLSYAEAAVRPFTLRAGISLLLPFASGVNADVLGTDPTMANGYMGVLIGVFALLAMFRKRTVVEHVLVSFGSICFLAAFGDALPVHKVLWAVLPGMDLFRFPSYFLWGVQLVVLVLAGGTLAQWPLPMKEHRKGVLFVLGASLVLVVVLFVLGWSRIDGTPVEADLYERLKALSTAQRIVLNGLMLVPVLTVTLVLVVRRRLTVSTLGLLVLVEMGWSTGLAAWNTSVADVSPFAVEHRIDAQPEGPITPLLAPMGEATDGSADLQCLWRNTQVYKGHPTHDGFNSFQLKHTMELQHQHAGLYQAMKRRPLVYLCDQMMGRTHYRPEAILAERETCLVVVEGQQQATVVQGASGTIVLTDLDHDRLAALVNVSAPMFLVVQQAWFPGWTMWVDGAEVEFQRANVAAFGAVVPAGEHVVEARFDKPIVPVLLVISLAGLMLALVLLMITGERALMAVRGPGLVVLAAMVLFSLFGHRSKAEGLQADLRDATLPAGIPVIVNTDREQEVRSLLPKAPAIIRCERPTDIPGLLHALEGVQGAHAEIWCAGLELPPGTNTLLNDQGWHVMSMERGARLVRHRLVRQLPGSEGHQLFRDELGGGRALVAPNEPYTAAFRVRVGDLAFAEGEWLAVDLRFRARSDAHGMVVLERKRGGKVTSYEAVPFHAHGRHDTAWVPAMVLRSRAELRDPEEELGIYLWNDAADTAWVKDLRVRMLQDGAP